MEPDAALALVIRIYRRLAARRQLIDDRERFKRGEQPLSFATAEWQKENAARYSGFADNWCDPVVTAEAERIRYTGMRFDRGNAAGIALHEHWMRNEMDSQQAQGIVTTLTTSRSFVSVWGDPNTDEPTISWEHPSNVEVEYDWANPRLRKAALKTWIDEDKEYATLDTGDFVWKYERDRANIRNERDSQAKQQKQVQTFVAEGWVPRDVPGETWPIINPMGVVATVEIPNRPELAGDPISEIQGVIPMQNAINMLWAYLFLAADYASMDARVVLGSAPPKIPILDSNGQKIGERPVDMKDLREKRLLYLTDKDAKIDSWKAAQLDMFTDTVEIAVGHIASQTRTPPTYLVSKTGMSNVNADGLKASEIGLNKKVLEFQEFAGPALREVNRLIALAAGDTKLAQATRLAKVSWMNPEIRSEAQLADMLVKKASIGYPFEYLLELDGVDPIDIPRIIEMKKRQDDAALGFGVQGAINDLGNQQEAAPQDAPAA